MAEEISIEELFKNSTNKVDQDLDNNEISINELFNVVEEDPDNIVEETQELKPIQVEVIETPKEQFDIYSKEGKNCRNKSRRSYGKTPDSLDKTVDFTHS